VLNQRGRESRGRIVINRVGLTQGHRLPRPIGRNAGLVKQTDAAIRSGIRDDEGTRRLDAKQSGSALLNLHRNERETPDIGRHITVRMPPAGLRHQQVAPGLEAANAQRHRQFVLGKHDGHAAPGRGEFRQRQRDSHHIGGEGIIARPPQAEAAMVREAQDRRAGIEQRERRRRRGLGRHV